MAKIVKSGFGAYKIKRKASSMPDIQKYIGECIFLNLKFFTLIVPDFDSKTLEGIQNWKKKCQDFLMFVAVDQLKEIPQIIDLFVESTQAVVMMLPSKTASSWFQTLLERENCTIEFLPARVKLSEEYYTTPNYDQILVRINTFI